MKTACFIAVAAFAVACHGDTAFSLGFDEVSLAPCASAAPALPESGPRHPGIWIINNYCKRISISTMEVDGEKCAELKLKGKNI